MKPDIRFSAEPVPYPLGEVEPNLRGKASFEVSAKGEGLLGIDQDLPPRSRTRAVRGSDVLGISEAELPLLFLSSRLEDSRYHGGRQGKAVDMTALERVFYDDLCRPKPNQPCALDDRRAPDCEVYSACEVRPGETQGICRAQCRAEQQDCKRSEDCCAGFVCDMLNQCAKCAGKGKACDWNSKCCEGLACDAKSHTCAPKPAPGVKK